MSRHPSEQGARYAEVFGSESMRMLHGCAAAELGRGTESPCRGLAHAGRRPQIGFGNPQARLVFLSPSPLDVGSAADDAFAEWLDREAGLEHDLSFERVLPYFRFVRAILLVLRQRLGQAPGKHDVIDLAFHTSVVRCATGNPDRVTDAAVGLCTARHLEPMLEAMNARAIVAMGGTVARYFWARSMAGWDGWQPIERLHGQTLSVAANGTPIPVVLSVHPYQRGSELRPEVIARSLADRLRPDDLLPTKLKAA